MTCIIQLNVTLILPVPSVAPEDSAVGTTIWCVIQVSHTLWKQVTTYGNEYELHVRHWLPMTRPSATQSDASYTWVTHYGNASRTAVYVNESRTTVPSVAPDDFVVAPQFDASYMRVTDYTHESRTALPSATVDQRGFFKWQHRPAFKSHELCKHDTNDIYASQTSHLIRHRGVLNLQISQPSKYVCESRSG